MTYRESRRSATHCGGSKLSEPPGVIAASPLGVQRRERRIQRREWCFFRSGVRPVYRKARHEAEIGLRFAGLDELVDLKGDVNSSFRTPLNGNSLGGIPLRNVIALGLIGGLLVSITPVQAGPLLDSALRHAKETRFLTVAAQPPPPLAPRTADSGRARSAGSSVASSCQ